MHVSVSYVRDEEIEVKLFVHCIFSVGRMKEKNANMRVLMLVY